MVYRACTCIWPLQVSKIADDDSISTAQRRVLLVTMVVMELVGGIILSMLSPFYPLVVRAPSVGMPPPCACNLSFDGSTTTCTVMYMHVKSVMPAMSMAKKIKCKFSMSCC